MCVYVEVLLMLDLVPVLTFSPSCVGTKKEINNLLRAAIAPLV